MKLVIQRVLEASVAVGDEAIAKIGHGLLVFVGIETADTLTDVQWLSNKIANIRLFDDREAIPNLSVKDIDGEVILVSQFTLHARTKKGHRPSYIDAARPEQAIPLYEALIRQLEQDLGKPVQTGKFGRQMQVSLVNEGPVTILIDSKNKH